MATTSAHPHRETLSRLGLTSAPVAVAFLAAPPPGVDHVGRASPAGCSYWKQAAEGRAFYTTPDDHANCPIGAYTHGVSMSPAQGAELESMLDTMIELKYIKEAEVPAFPHRTQPLEIVAYAPLAGATFAADVVIFRGNVRQIMLLAEAAKAGGVFDAGPVMGRPACAMVPQSIGTGAGVASVGCIGNRVYTGLGDDEMYLTVPGAAVDNVLGALAVTLDANEELERFHRARA
jgi:uncharacterized protein (DUF169 family)